ncbi:MAG TPA: DUF3800 domain-containing protein [Lichenihabitans sp.]|nr:DUF3800 domain-containing protein [Lichenihabitans sp.]
MRIAYLDESGRSRGEPVIVVAGVIVNGDRTYRKLEAALRIIASEELPKEDAQSFIFHAKELLHGGGYFHRDRWPSEKRHVILMRLAKLPAEFALPVVFGHIGKQEYRASLGHSAIAAAGRNSDEVVDVAEHMTAFARVEIAVERQMHLFSRDEICMVIAEDTDRVKRAVKEAHAILRDPGQVIQFGLPELSGLPVRKIVDTPHFAAKTESPLLQLADVCAFLIMRRIKREESSQPFFEAIAPQLSWTCKDFGDRMGSELLCSGARF